MKKDRMFIKMIKRLENVEEKLDKLLAIYEPNAKAAKPKKDKVAEEVVIPKKKTAEEVIEEEITEEEYAEAVEESKGE